jgi:hypothetical protein
MHRIKAHVKESPTVKAHPQRIIAGFGCIFMPMNFSAKL